VTGGSREYVERAAKQLPDVRLGTPVRAVRRHQDHVQLRDAAGQPHRFDAVVIATHPDQALRLLDPPTAAERTLLTAFTYTRNAAVLHTDTGLLPRGRHTRAAWNYRLSGCQPDDAAVRISYHMNRLQDLRTSQDYIVTLGAEDAVDPRLVLRCQGMRLYLRGLPVIPRPAHCPQEGVQ
jgi:predicted NAD/FAD-binding protein